MSDNSNEADVERLVADEYKVLENAVCLGESGFSDAFEKREEGWYLYNVLKAHHFAVENDYESSADFLRAKLLSWNITPNP